MGDRVNHGQGKNASPAFLDSSRDLTDTLDMGEQAFPPRPKRFPVPGRDFTIPQPEHPVMQDVRERIDWANLTPEDRFRQANLHRIWSEVSQAETHGPERIAASLRRRFDGAQST